MAIELGFFDIGCFALFFAFTLGFSMWRGRQEKDSKDYFLAGKQLTWPMIGLSIIAANISTEQFVGMAGQAAGDTGLAVSAYGIAGAIGIVIVAFTFLPRFLKTGVYTLPQFLEYRYNIYARSIIAIAFVVIYVCVLITAVIYSGGLTLNIIFGVDMVTAAWGIGLVAAFYTIWGGLKSVASADLFFGTGLLLGGMITLYLGMQAVGGVDTFMAANEDRLHIFLPSDNPQLPWTGLVFGLWIPAIYYTGFNQFIVQRTLAAKSLEEGQKGAIFAALLWLLVPFFIVMPGLLALQLYGSQLTNPDQAYPMLIRELIPSGIRGLIFAALFGAVVSSLASMLNSASTIATMDIFKRLIAPQATERELVRIGRVLTGLFVIAGCLIAPIIADPRFKGVFHYIQEFQGYISPGIVAAFIIGIAVPRAPVSAGLAALLGSPIIYGLLQLAYGDLHFLVRMVITFAGVSALMLLLTLVRPLDKPREFPVDSNYRETKPTWQVKAMAVFVILSAITFLFIFR